MEFYIIGNGFTIGTASATFIAIITKAVATVTIITIIITIIIIIIIIIIIGRRRRSACLSRERFFLLHRPKF